MGTLSVKHAGTWKQPTTVAVKKAGAWVTPVGVFVKSAGTWSKVWPGSDPALKLDLDFTTTTILDPRITFSRTSLGTYYGSDGLLKYAGHNLALQSQTFDNASWGKAAGGTITADNTTAPNGTTTADRLNHVTAGTVIGGNVLQTAGSASTYRTLYSVYAKAGTKGWLILGTASSGSTLQSYFNLTTGVVGTRGSNWVSTGIEDAGSGWWRCYGVVPAAASQIYIQVAETGSSANCTSPGDIYIWGAQAEAITTATTPSTYIPTVAAAVHGPRFDYDPVSHAPKGLLIEEARTNLFWWSQQFNTTWSATGLTVTVDQTVAPDGTTTADLLTASATTADINQSMTASSSVAIVQSVYAKKGTSDWCYLTSEDTTPAGTPKAYFNLATGSVGTIESPLTAATIQAVGSGWYRCTVGRVSGSGTHRLRIGICNADASATVTVGRTIYAWGGQGEVGAFVTSYVPTVGGSGARAADVATMTGTAFSSWYNASAGTFVAEFDLFDASKTIGIICADDGGASNLIELDHAFGNLRALITTAGSTALNASMAPPVLRTTQKLGVSFAANDFAVSLNGGSVTTDTSGALPTLTQMRFGTSINGVSTQIMSGHLRRIRFYNVAKSDADLRTLTT